MQFWLKHQYKCEPDIIRGGQFDSLQGVTKGLPHLIWDPVLQLVLLNICTLGNFSFLLFTADFLLSTFEYYQHYQSVKRFDTDHDFLSVLKFLCKGYKQMTKLPAKIANKNTIAKCWYPL